MTRLVDTHAHLDARQFEGDRDDVISRASSAGLCAVVTIGTDLRSSETALSIAKTPGVYVAVGIHPHSASEIKETGESVRALVKKEHVVGVGEVGLDYYRNLSDPKVQRECFAYFIDVAKQSGLPLIVHSRDADEDVLDILTQEGAGDVYGVFHCFSGDWDMAKTVLDLGFYVSLAGPVTFKNAPNLWEVAEHVPLDRLLVETDCPYLAPTPYRGKRNEPAFVRLVAERVATLKHIDTSDVISATTANAFELFGLDKGWELPESNSTNSGTAPIKE